MVGPWLAIIFLDDGLRTEALTRLALADDEGFLVGTGSWWLKEKNDKNGQYK